MGIIKRLIQILFEKENDIVGGYYTNQIEGMQRMARSTSIAREKGVKLSESSQPNIALNAYLKGLRSFRDEYASSLSRRELFEFDTQYRELEQQHQWISEQTINNN